MLEGISCKLGSCRIYLAARQPARHHGEDWLLDLVALRCAVSLAWYWRSSLC